jgi:hypothetical protein
VASDISSQLRTEVARRARHRCEYCLILEDDAGFQHEVDHILSRKNGGSSVSDNLAYACVICNRSKGSDVASINPETGDAVRLFDPRRDLWTDHFRFDGALIEAQTDIGAATMRVLQLNRLDRVAERSLLQAIERYPKF